MNKKHFYAAVILFSFLVAGIQPAFATKFIPSDPDIGELAGNTYTLTTDVYETIQIIDDGITLNGAGHTVTASGLAGIKLDLRSGVTVKNVIVENFVHGIYLTNSNNNYVFSNTLRNNGLAGSSGGGIGLQGADGNEINYNTIQNNYNGIVISGTSLNNQVYQNDFLSNTQRQVYLKAGSGNQIYNNDFNGEGTWWQVEVGGGSYSDIYYNNFFGGSNNTSIPYHYQVYVTGGNDNRIYNNNFFRGTGTFFRQAYVDNINLVSNVFNLALPIGGNYWSDWGPPAHPDGNGDGIVDDPRSYWIGPSPGGVEGYDYLPWVAQDGWKPEVLIQQLIVKVEALNGEYGISNALDAKLQNALDALEAKNAGQRQDAVNKMQAFINGVEAQIGNKIPGGVADDLISAAENIIALL